MRNPVSKVRLRRMNECLPSLESPAWKSNVPSGERTKGATGDNGCGGTYAPEDNEHPQHFLYPTKDPLTQIPSRDKRDQKSYVFLVCPPGVRMRTWNTGEGIKNMPLVPRFTHNAH